MKSKLEIIDETIDYYRKNPRSIEDFRCLYLGSNNQRCALSRCCTEEGVLRLSNHEGVSIVSFIENGLIIEELLKPEYKGHCLDFWMNLQYIHDYNCLWKDNMLSDEGIKEVNRIRNKWKDE
jgi:hypothetical protein